MLVIYFLTKFLGFCLQTKFIDKVLILGHVSLVHSKIEFFLSITWQSMQFRKKKTFQLIFIKLQVFRVEMKMVIITHYHILMFFSFFLFNLLFQEGWTHSRYTFLWHCQNKDFFKVLKKMYDHIFQFDEYREKIQ